MTGDSRLETAPPIGLTPRSSHIRSRVLDIVNAMSRYNEVGKKIPDEWFEELIELNSNECK